ncbi:MULTISPECIES: invasion associated locus B family protein [Xanthobacter]|uniref:invasion associated locus B family protein n=1 Tax=Xanthobacter TaxID=279 RepID=UPI001AE7997D|nr:invasion associated locus B family protein [Xanthobacter flavus]MBP2150177.1 invasion protein IalB [Xanthobacter flavus]
MTLPRVHPALLGMFLACAAAAPAAAQGQPQSKAVAQFGDWSVYVSTSSPKVCYAISQPKTRAPEGLKRDPAYFFISTRPGENVKNEVTVTVGFPLKEGSDATLTVGNATLQLYTKDQGAWVRNVADESKLVDAMKRGKDLTVASTSLRGNVTTDKYSLVGLAQALDRVAQECK